VRYDKTGHADGWIQRLVERVLPLGIGRIDDVGAFGRSDVVDQDVDASEGLEGGADDLLGPGGGLPVWATGSTWHLPCMSGLIFKTRRNER